VEELLFDAQGPASIPGVGGVIKSPTQPDHVLNIVHSYKINKKPPWWPSHFMSSCPRSSGLITAKFRILRVNARSRGQDRMPLLMHPQSQPRVFFRIFYEWCGRCGSSKCVSREKLREVITVCKSTKSDPGPWEPEPHHVMAPAKVLQNQDVAAPCGSGSAVQESRISAS
jgi:hypothetical protein